VRQDRQDPGRRRHHTACRDGTARQCRPSRERGGRVGPCAVGHKQFDTTHLIGLRALQRVDRGIAIFESIIRRGVAAGEFRDVVPGHAARLCVAPMLVLILWRTTFAQFDESPYDYQGLVDTHLATLLHGLSITEAKT